MIRLLYLLAALLLHVHAVAQQATIVNLSPEDHRRALAGEAHLLRSCGRPSAGAQVKIMDMSGNLVANGEVGEIWVKSPSNMLGYFNMEEETAKSLTDGGKSRARGIEVDTIMFKKTWILDG